MVLGGLPFFFSLMHPHQSLWENIGRLCLAPRPRLRDETMALLEGTMRTSRIYPGLFALLAQHKYGMRKQDAVRALGCSAKQFNAAAGEAEKCGCVRKCRVPGRGRRGEFVQLVDPFILFRYHFIDPPSGRASRSWSDFVADQGRYACWRGNAFEVVCLHHVAQLKAALGIGGVATVEYPWSSERREGGQIDLVIERADRVVDLCEMKFADGPYELSAANERKLVGKREVFREETGCTMALKTVLVSAGDTSGNHDGAIARKLGIDDLFS